ncbi:hypothetical protein AURDEDRAFT_174104 [Auricularia subglabra TFB-10046 SS5]|nr:hypothetical protein AURDEDRAFT_174104 [Auricularia subglabra TFB-10046 SS5]
MPSHLQADTAAEILRPVLWIPVLASSTAFDTPGVRGAGAMILNAHLRTGAVPRRTALA